MHIHLLCAYMHLLTYLLTYIAGHIYIDKKICTACRTSTQQINRVVRVHLFPVFYVMKLHVFYSSLAMLRVPRYEQKQL